VRRKLGAGAALLCALWLPVAGVQAAAPRWTLLAYMQTSGQLEAAANGYLQQFGEALEGQARGGQVQVAAQVEGAGALADPGLARRVVWSGGERTETQVRSGEMDAPGAVSDFLAWGVRAAPAERYLLLVLGHGRPPDENGPWPGGFRLSHLAQGLARSGPDKLEVVFLDCCYAGSMESAHLLRGEARFLVAPPGLLYAPGLPCGRILAALVARPEMTPRELSVLAVDQARELWSAQPGRTAGLLAMDLERAGELRPAVGDLAQALRAALEPSLANLTLARGQAMAWGAQAEVVDGTALAEALAQVSAEPGVAQAAARLAGALRAATVVAWAQGSGGGQTVCGPALYFPLGLGPGLARYENWPAGSLPAAWSPLLRAYLERMAGSGQAGA